MIIQWFGLLLVSVLIHCLFSWKASEQLGWVTTASPDKNNTTTIDLTQSLVVTEENDSLVIEQAMVFEQTIDFEPPSALINSEVLAPPPPDVNLALQAAAGGRADTGFDIPLVQAVQSYGTGLAGFGVGAGEGLTQSSHSFAAYVKSLRETGLDVVFVVDTTGSMGWVITEVNQRIVDIVDTIRSLVPITRFGVVAYRDFGDPEFVTKIQPLTFSLNKLVGFLSGLEAKGGGSWQEAISAGLARAASDAQWRVSAHRVIILIGDAPPHEENYQSILTIAEGVVAQGGQISSLDVSHDSNPALLEKSLGRPVNRALYRDRPMLQFQAIAEAGQGVAATMDGDVDITRQLLSLIMGGQFSIEMGLLMEGL